MLEGKKVRLDPLQESDADGRYPDWFNDPEVCYFNSHGAERNTREKTLDYIRKVRASGNTIVFAIRDRQSGTHIGNVAIQDIDRQSRHAELAIIIGEKAYWSGGAGKEAWQLAMSHALGDLGLKRVYCGTREDNVGMQKVALASGMKEEGRLRQHAFKHGRFFDIILYGFVKE